MARYFWGADAGRAILKVVLEELKRELPQGNIAIRLQTRVNGLLMSGSGAVEGVRAQSGEEEWTFRGRHVLLTSGGYAMNSDMFELLTGYPAYAAGEVMGSGTTLGSTFAPGMMLTPALSLGRWLGMTLPI